MTATRNTPKPAPARRPVHLCGEELAHAAHVCAFFDSRREKYDALTPYLAEGIQHGDRIVNVVDAEDRESHVRTLEHARIPVTQAIERGQLQLLTAEETYLREGQVNLDGMLELLRDVLESATRAGTSVRTCGEMNWIGRSRMPADVVMEYEARVNDFLPAFQCMLVCVYDIAQTPAGLIADILATHPIAVINGRLRENPYFVEPASFLGMLRNRQSVMRSGHGSVARA